MDALQVIALIVGVVSAVLGPTVGVIVALANRARKRELIELLEKSLAVERAERIAEQVQCTTRIAKLEGALEAATSTWLADATARLRAEFIAIVGTQQPGGRRKYDPDG